MVAPEQYFSSTALLRFLISFVLFVGVSLSSYNLFLATDVARFPIIYSVDLSFLFRYVSNAAPPPPVSSHSHITNYRLIDVCLVIVRLIYCTDLFQKYQI